MSARPGDPRDLSLIPLQNYPGIKRQKASTMRSNWICVYINRHQDDSGTVFFSEKKVKTCTRYDGIVYGLVFVALLCTAI